MHAWQFRSKSDEIEGTLGQFFAKSRTQWPAILPLYCLWPLTIKYFHKTLFFAWYRRYSKTKTEGKFFFQSDAMRKENDVTFFFLYTNPIYFYLPNQKSISSPIVRSFSDLYCAKWFTIDVAMNLSKVLIGISLMLNDLRKKFRMCKSPS